MKNIERVLVTGGLGFIGSHVVDALLDRGYCVRILDNLEPQIHGGRQNLPDFVNKEAEIIIGDVRRGEDLTKALADVDAVIHLSAAVGVAQSMVQIEKYIDYNTKRHSNTLRYIS